MSIKGWKHSAAWDAVLAARVRKLEEREDKIVGTTSLNLEADRLLAIIRSDLLLMGHGNLDGSPWMHNAIGANLRSLADVIEAGGMPDPFPHFRHGEPESAFLQAVGDCKDKDELWDFVTNHFDRGEGTDA